MEDTTIEDVLKTIEALHNQKDYEGAIKVLETHKEELSPGTYHYNMGTLYGRIENLPLSRFHFLMADIKGNTTKELFQNKNLVEERLDIQKLEKPLSVEDYFIKGSLFASQGIFTLLSLVLIILGIIGARRKSFKPLIACLAFSGLFLGLNFWVQSWNKFIVVTPQPVLEGPSAIFEGREELPLGIMLVTTQEGEWHKVIFPSRFSGWIKSTGLKELK